MKVINLSNNSVLEADLKIAASFSDNLLGFLKNSNPQGWMFKTRFGIHTFFLKEPIDVIILDRNFKVVKIAEVQPNKLFFWNPKYFYILELPKGTVKKTKTKIDDILRLDS